MLACIYINIPIMHLPYHTYFMGINSLLVPWLLHFRGGINPHRFFGLFYRLKLDLSEMLPSEQKSGRTCPMSVWK